MRKVASGRIRSLVHESLALVQLSGLDRRKPAQLSGGQQQRVALARALVFRPHVLLMDEPLGALDKKLREEMQIELKHIQHQLGITVLSVTHDQEEALTLSDRIAVINAGRLEQIGTAHEIYEQPATPFVADFIGETNFLNVRVDATDGRWLMLSNEGLHSVKVGAVDGVNVGDSGILSVRPEKISFFQSEQEIECCAEGVVNDILYIGDTTKYYVELQNRQKIVVKQHNREGMPHPTSGESVWIGWGAGNGVWIPGDHNRTE
jgi:ABC-type Fe3+/spermidine/putrescine transport system ATPase subunit